MCEFCHSAPHLPGCPNEPEVDHTKRCALCGDRVDEDELTGGVCEDCLDKSFTGQKMLEFIEEDPCEFVEWYFDVHVRYASYKDEVVKALMEVFLSHYRREKKLALEDLRDYCSDDTAIWLEFLGVEPDE